MGQAYFREFKQLLIPAIPLVLAQLAQIATSFVDTLMVARLGNEALAGIAIGSVIYMFVAIMLSGVVLGVNAIVSQATGGGDDRTCGRAVRQGFWLGLLMWVPAMLLFWNVEPLLLWAQQPPSTAAASAGYLRAISWGLLPALMTFSLRGLLEGKSNTRPIMIVMVIGVMLNVVANEGLMFGKWGLPELGLVGTGYASSIVLTNNFLCLALYCHFRYPDLHLFTQLRTPDAGMMRQLIRIGGPIGLTLGFEASMFFAAALTMGTLGKEPLAAHQIVMQVASVSFMIPLGLAIATSSRVGQKIGARQPAQARLAAHVGIGTAALVMCVAALAFWLVPRSLIQMFLQLDDPANENVVQFAIQFLAIAGMFQVFDGIQVAANLSLRGLKDTFAPMVLTLISYLAVGCVVGGVLCFPMGLEGRGLWFGLTAGLATASVLLVIRFEYRIRREIKLAEDR